MHGVILPSIHKMELRIAVANVLNHYMFHSNRTGSPVTGVTSVSPFKMTFPSTEERDPSVPYVSPV